VKKSKIILLLIVSIIVIIIGNYFKTIYVSAPYLFPLGLTNANFTSMDYYPFFPWLGVFIFGIILGKTAYANKTSLFSFSLENNLISSLGRHSLVIYLVHQPVILVFLWLIKKYIVR
jgi:uncharacterized membrane protein